MELPEHNDSYGNQTYWDDRYSNEESSEWFAAYEKFRDLILDTVKKSDRILMLGCGNSSLSDDMYKDGYTNITNMDYSPVVIRNMEEKYPHMKWDVMDVMSMTYSSGDFDVILEKGTIDALLVGEKDPWRMSDESQELMDTILSQVSRILANGGRFISITFAQPHFRLPVFAREEYEWSLESRTFGSMFHFYYFIMEKGGRISPDTLEFVSRLEKNRNRVNEEIYYVSEDDEDFLSNCSL